MTYQMKRKVTGFVFLTPYVLSFTCFLLLPILVAAGLAFMRFDLTARESIQFVGLQNFRELAKDAYFAQAMLATCRYAVLMVPSLIISAFAMALGLNAISRGREMVRALIFLPGMFTIAVTAILWQWFYNLEFGLFNFILKHFGFGPVSWLSDKKLAMPSIVVMALWWTAGGTSVVLLTALQQIPRMYIEAAALDGAGGVRLFTRITLPLLRPVLFFVVLTNTIGAFQMFPQASLLTAGGPEQTTRGVVQYMYETAFNFYRLGYAASISWALTLVIIVFIVAQIFAFRRNID